MEEYQPSRNYQIQSNKNKLEGGKKLSANEITYQRMGFIYQTCSGTCRGIWLVLTGCSKGAFR